MGSGITVTECEAFPPRPWRRLWSVPGTTEHTFIVGPLFGTVHIAVCKYSIFSFLRSPMFFRSPMLALAIFILLLERTLLINNASLLATVISSAFLSPSPVPSTSKVMPYCSKLKFPLSSFMKGLFFISRVKFWIFLS